MAGAPTKYSAARVKAICAALKQGCTRTVAAEANGIDRETIRLWMRDNPAFFGAVIHAEAEAERAMTRAVHAAATGKEPDWRAAVEWLKRRRREEWGDGLELKIGRMGEDELRDYILGRAVPVEPGAVESGGDRAALGPGAGYPIAADED